MLGFTFTECLPSTTNPKIFQEVRFVFKYQLEGNERTVALWNLFITSIS